MSLSVIGSGIGRTGTMSLKIALERLGFGRCYHMVEVMENPSHIPLWSAAADGQKINWDQLFEKYGAAVDYPSAAFWRDLADHFPNAKIIHTVRDPDRWYESATNTIFRHMSIPPPPDSPVAALAAMARKVSFERTFDGRVDDRAYAISVFKRLTEEVKREIAPDRLLVFEVAQGWEPLCTFLDVPIPDEPFPRTNDREEFQKLIEKAEAGS